MKYDERLLQVRTAIADARLADEDRRRAREAQRPGRMRNVVLGGGRHLAWKIPILIGTITLFVLYPKAILRAANRYIGLPNWVVELVPGLDGASMPGPLALIFIGLAVLAVVVAGLGVYLYVRRSQVQPAQW